MTVENNVEIKRSNAKDIDNDAIGNKKEAF